jgi:hypothetical protein
MTREQFLDSNCIDCNKPIKVKLSRKSIATYRCKKCHTKKMSDRMVAVSVARANRIDNKYYKGK